MAEKPFGPASEPAFLGAGLDFRFFEELRNDYEQVLSLPDDTLLCPGHGPLTTVGEEKLHNPFFPQFQAGVSTQGH